MPGNFLYLQNAWGEPPPALRQVRGHRIEVFQQYDAERLDWSGYDAVLVSMSADQIHLCEMTNKLAAYLDGGGTLLINGHVTRPFLPELTRYEPMEKRGRAELVIHREAELPPFEGVTGEQLTLRRGVAGFYGRGTNPPPNALPPPRRYPSINLGGLPTTPAAQASAGRIFREWKRPDARPGLSSRDQPDRSNSPSANCHHANQHERTEDRRVGRGLGHGMDRKLRAGGKRRDCQGPDQFRNILHLGRVEILDLHIVGGSRHQRTRVERVRQ